MFPEDSKVRTWTGWHTAVPGVMCYKDVLDRLATECVVNLARREGDEFSVTDADSAYGLQVGSVHLALWANSR